MSEDEYLRARLQTNRKKRERERERERETFLNNIDTHEQIKNFYLHEVIWVEDMNRSDQSILVLLSSASFALL